MSCCGGGCCWWKKKQPTTLEEVLTSFEKVDIASQADVLVAAIEQQLEGQTPQKDTEDTPSTSLSNRDKLSKLDSFIQSGAKFLKFVIDSTQKFNTKDDFFQSGEATTIIGHILDQIGQLHWTVGALSIVGYLVKKCQKVSENRTGYVEVLKDMLKVVSHIKRLNNLSLENENKENLKNAFQYIIKVSVFCATNLDSGKFCSFFKSSINSDTLSGIRSNMDKICQDLQLIAGIEALAQQQEILAHQKEMLARQPVVLPLSQQGYPKNAVGIAEQLEAVNKLLNMEKTEDFSSSAVVIWGFGGIGKTTLAEAVVSTVDRKRYNYARVLLDEDSKINNYKEMQENILRDAFPTYMGGGEIKLRDDSDGRDKLTDAFKTAANKPMFLFIDNALLAQDLKKILPDDLEGLPQRSRILITTRNKGVADVLQERRLQCNDYHVKTLSDNHAVEILCNDPAFRDRMEDELDRIVKVCNGIPLVLKIVGAHLRKQEYNAERCTQIVGALQEGRKIKEDELSNRLFHFVYDKLEESTQEAFLDICCFFDNSQSAKTVEYVVGAEQFTSLQEAAFLDIDEEDEINFSVHDIIRSIGRSLSKSSRIIDLNSWREAEKDEAKLKGIKGVRLEDEDCLLEKRHLNLMEDTLRILEWDGRIDVHDTEAVTLPELRFISTSGDMSWLNVQALDKLTVLECEKLPTKLTGPLRLPESLKKIIVSNQPAEMGDLLKTVLNSSLEVLFLYFSEPNECSKKKEDNSEEANNSGVKNNSEEADTNEVEKNSVKNALNSFLQGLNKLKYLAVGDCQSLCELPEQVCWLPQLRRLSIQNCSNIERLPELIGQLTTLEVLSLTDCSGLLELPSTFGQLGQLATLEDLDLSNCKSLKELPSTFGQLKTLTDLSLPNCENLKELPSTFSQLPALQTLDLSNCKSLKELPFTFGQLKTLTDLFLPNCENLKELPSTFSQLPALTGLNLSNCKSLEELPFTFGQLKTLKILYLSYCENLKELPFTFHQLEALEYLVMEGCKRLEQLPGSFEQLRSLQYINLRFCDNLESDICQIDVNMKIVRKSEHSCTDCQKDKKLTVRRTPL